MPLSDLPRDVSRQSLSYAALIAVLNVIGPELVVVHVSARGDSEHDPPGLVSIVGRLEHQVPARYEGDEFSLGTPYPDREPASLAGGVLFLSEEEFEAASLTTYDGNDYFIVSVRTRTLAVVIEDAGSSYP